MRATRDAAARCLEEAVRLESVEALARLEVGRMVGRLEKLAGRTRTGAPSVFRSGTGLA